MKESDNYDQETILPDIHLPDDFDTVVENALRNGYSGENGGEAPILVPAKLYYTIARLFAKFAWSPSVSAIRSNSLLYLKQSRELITKYNPIYEDNHIQFNHKKLIERVRFCLEKLVLRDQMMQSEDIIVESNNNHSAIQTEVTPTESVSKKTRKTRLSPDKRFEQFLITRTGSKDDPNFTKDFTPNTVLLDAVKVILPVSALEIIASWLIQASQKDAATALIFGLLYVLGSTITFVISARFAAIVKGHKAFQGGLINEFTVSRLIKIER